MSRKPRQASVDQISLDFADIERRAHQLRAEAFRNMLVGFRDWLSRTLFSYHTDHDTGIDALYSMSDRELADIGLSRGDIPSIADGSFEDSHGRMISTGHRDLEHRSTV